MDENDRASPRLWIARDQRTASVAKSLRTAFPAEAVPAFNPDIAALLATLHRSVDEN